MKTKFHSPPHPLKGVDELQEAWAPAQGWGEEGEGSEQLGGHST